MKRSKTKDEHEKKHEETLEKLLIGNYQTQKIIGKGSFGIIFEAKLVDNVASKNSQTFALKIEKNSLKDSFLSQLNKEVTILTQCQNIKGFATLYDHGVYKGNPFMVTSLLGHNLQKALKISSGKFDQETTLRIAYQMIDRIASLHQKGFLHRDIKPENFVLGINENSKVLYIIDFGLSKKYLDKDNRKHIPLSTNKGFVGTARYASPNAHKGFEQGRRDDLISIGYLLMYFLKGKLPWQGLLIDAKDKKYEGIGKIKEDFDYISFFKGYNSAFLSYLQYVLKLEYDATPSYQYIKELFQKGFEEIANLQKKVKKNEKLEKNIDKKEVKNEDNEEEKENKELKEILLGHINEQEQGEKIKIAGKFQPKSKLNLCSQSNNEISKTSTMKPNYDYSSCELGEEETTEIQKTYEFFKANYNLASKGFNFSMTYYYLKNC